MSLSTSIIFLTRASGGWHSSSAIVICRVNCFFLSGISIGKIGNSSGSGGGSVDSGGGGGGGDGGDDSGGSGSGGSSSGGGNAMIFNLYYPTLSTIFYLLSTIDYVISTTNATRQTYTTDLSL